MAFFFLFLFFPLSHRSFIDMIKKNKNFDIASNVFFIFLILVVFAPDPASKCLEVSRRTMDKWNWYPSSVCVLVSSSLLFSHVKAEEIFVESTVKFLKIAHEVKVFMQRILKRKMISLNVESLYWCKRP